MRYLFLLLFSFLSNLTFSQNIWLHNRIIDNITPIENVKSISFSNVYILQTHSLLSKSDIHELNEKGVTFWNYIPNNAYLVTFNLNFKLSDLYLKSIKTLFELSPEDKLQQSIYENTVGNWAVEGDNYLVNCKYLPLICSDTFMKNLTEINCKILHKYENEDLISLSIPFKNIPLLAAFGNVLFIEPIAPPAIADDNRGRALHRSNLLNIDRGIGYKLDGSGINVLVRDDGNIGPHIDFKNRVDNSMSTDNATSPSNTNHGDGVAGIIGSAGNLNPMMAGMAKGAFIFTTDYENSYTDTTLGLHKYRGVNITNSSYSDGCNTFTSVSQRIDKQLYENEKLMHVFSAGNNNGANCNYKGGGAGGQWGNITGGHKLAKNSIATGNLNPELGLDTTSSRGPTYDGRIKPDICANGTRQNSNGINNTYVVFGGTSAAAPGIAGILAQLMQGYKEINNGESPDAALLKCALMNTANDLGNPGPDFKFGWGHVNAFRAYKLLESKRYLTDKIDLNEIQTKEITVDDNTKEVRFMLYWADIEPSIISKIALVNNLDLKVITPSGKELYPWVLDTTPKAANLNMPATFGIDNLNNVEQVLISYPETGTYKIIINGKSIPFGPQKYFLTHEIIPISDVAITYPIGGESLVPNDKIGIFWDAKEDGQYNLSYSTNDKGTWTPIGSSTGSKRYMDWVVPSVISGKVWLKISGVNGSFETKAPLSIIPVPTNIKVDNACIDSMSISWNKVTGADFYTIHYLNEKYMDSIGISNTNSFTIPIKNPVAENWFSVSANNFENITGRRAIAVLYNSGLKSCPQAFDAGVTNILSPISTKFSCSNIADSVKISIKNNGNNVISNFNVSYQLNNESPITEEITDTIKVGSSYVYTFKTPVQISTSGENVIKTWLKLQDDIVFYNDTLNTKVKFFIFKNNIQYNSSENFESSNFPPDNWIIDNNDITTWSRINCIGSDGNPTNAAYINTFNYKNKTIGARDRLYLPTITIPDTANTPYISFDLSNVRKNTSTSDSLLIHVYENCNNKLLNTIFKKSSYTMASAQNSLQNWIPSAKGHWRNYALDLSEFKGKSVIIVFESVNGNSNNIYIDNINLANNLLVAPIADFNIDKTEGCINADTVTITPNIIAGNSLNYLWNFGFGGSPSSTSQLIGPHKIKWLSAGVKNITLTVYNGLDTIVITKSLTIKPSPVSSFSNLNNGNTVDFTNTSTNANSYLWEFGDGTTSTDINPTHTYLSTGTYYVSLTSEGQCGTSKINKAIVLTTPNKEVSDVVQCNLFPKVATNEVFLQIEKSKSNKIQNELFDINGKLIRKFEFENSGEKTSYKLTISDLANGFYLVKTKINDQIFTNNFIKQ